MPLRRIPGLEAIANIRTNPFAEWPTRTDADTNRIEPLCKPAFSPSFKLEWGEKIFTIGSCFARNVERALQARGFDVVTSSVAWPDSSVDTHGNSILNNYGVVSIENELRWALDPEHPFDPATQILEVTPGRFVDPHVLIRGAPLEKILAYRAAIAEVNRRVVDCRVVVMTLGLSELWFDRATGTYLNLTPPRMLVSRQPERFELHLLDFADTMKSLTATIDLLRARCRSDQHVLLTVSPVPMHTTHSTQDVLVVNAYSKAVLRTAAEHVASAYPHVDYFPSYESVVMSERALAWESDQLHVNKSLIHLNVERMLEAYGPAAATPDAADIGARIREAQEELAAHNPAAAIRILEPLRDARELDPEFALFYAEVCIRLGRPADARAATRKLPADAADWRRDLIEARIAVREGDAEKGLAALTGLRARFPKRVPILRFLLDAYVQLQRFDEALQTVVRWSELAPKQSEPFRRAALIHRSLGDAAAAERAFRAAVATNDASDSLLLDYVDFLIDENRLADAARELRDVRAQTQATLRRVERLRSLLPEAAAAGGG